MKKVPASHKDLLKDQTKAFAYLATTMKDGFPQVTPIWFNTEDDYIMINSAEGRVKDRNMRARPLVALVIADPNDPYRYLQIQGRVIGYTPEGADEHIDALSYKYTGNEKYQWRNDKDTRIKYTISIEKVDAH